MTPSYPPSRYLVRRRLPTPRGVCLGGRGGVGIRGILSQHYLLCARPLLSKAIMLRTTEHLEARSLKRRCSMLRCVSTCCRSPPIHPVGVQKLYFAAGSCVPASGMQLAEAINTPSNASLEGDAVHTGDQQSKGFYGCSPPK